MARPKLGETATERMQLKITTAEIEAIDDWRFANRVPSRSEAVRRLCQIGMLTSKSTSAMNKHTNLAMAEMVLFLHDVAKACSGNPDDPISLKIRLAVEQYGKSALLNSAQASTEVGELSNHLNQLLKHRDLEESLAVVASNIIRKGEVDALTVDFVSDVLKEFK